MDRVRQTQPWLDAVEVRVRGLGPCRDRVPGHRVRPLQIDRDEPVKAGCDETHGLVRRTHEAMEAVVNTRLVERVACCARLGRADRAVVLLVAPFGARQFQRGLGALRVRQCEIKMMTGVVGQPRLARIGGAQRDFQRMRIDEPVHRFETEAERIAAACCVAVGERHAQAGAVHVGVGFEGQVACKTVHRQFAHRALCVTPEADLAVDAMPAEKRKQQRVAAANPGGLAPVGVLGPMDHLFAVDDPR